MLHNLQWLVPLVCGGSFFLRMARCETVALLLLCVRRLNTTATAPLASLAGECFCSLRFRLGWDAIRGRLYIAEDRSDVALEVGLSGTSERVI